MNKKPNMDGIIFNILNKTNSIQTIAELFHMKFKNIFFITLAILTLNILILILIWGSLR